MPFVTGNFYLTQAQMEENALYIWNGIQNLGWGWTMEAVSGMLGNMQTESTINPGIWQNLEPAPPHEQPWGFGLVQWTPSTNYTDWCATRPTPLDPSHMNSALLRINWELENNQQWIATSAYPLSFKDFLTSTAEPEYLAYAFLYNYERPASLDQPNRKTQARKWYEFLGGAPPPPPEKHRKLPLYYYVRRF